MAVKRWSDKTREQISKTLKGRSKSDETRARMHATRMVGQDQDTPEWKEAYNDYLHRIDILRKLDRKEL